MKHHILNDLSHLLMSTYIKENDTAIDLTMGNGYDTLHLAKLAKNVYAFDIQQQALDETKKLLIAHDIKDVKLILDSHENVLNYLSEFDYAVFNLGYLPKGDKTITTEAETTIKTLQSMLSIMKVGSFIQLMVYKGHPKGLIESVELDRFLKTLDSNCYKIIRIDLPYQKNEPPYILLIHKYI